MLWDKGRIELWGGEPLVYYKVLKYLIPKLRNRWKKAFISIVTNGSLLDKEKIDFFLKYNVHITISHDGPGFHLRNKDDPMNDPKMVEIWKYLLDKSIEAENPMGFNVVISPANYDLYKIAEFFKKFDERVSFGFEGIVNYHSDSQSLMIFDKQKRDTLTQQIFEIITSQWDNPVWHSIQQRAIRLLEWLVYAKPANSISAKCESTSDQVLAVTLKGDVLSCQNCDPVEFKIGRKITSIKIDEIMYCTYLGGMNTVIVNDNKQVIVKNKSFKEVLELLGDDFILISRRTAINKNKISNISDKGVYLKGEKRLFNVSRRQKKIVLKAFFEEFIDDK